MCLYFALMYKTLGGYNWSDLFANSTSNATCAIPMTDAIMTSEVVDDGFGEFTEEQSTLDKSILESAKELQSSFHGLKAVNCCLIFFSSIFFFPPATKLIFFLIFSVINYFRYLRPTCIAVYSDLPRGGRVLCGLQHLPLE